MMKFRKLRADEIEVKVKMTNDGGSVFLLYKTARTDMDILDETVGPENWQCAYETIKDNLYCKIGIWDEKKGQWIWKQDCGIESREDGEGNEKKGEASDAFKRAGFKWGIGRELYTSPFIWVKSDVVPVVETFAGSKKYRIKDKFAKFYVSKIGYTDSGDICTLVIKDNKNNTVYTYGKDVRNETIVTTPPEPNETIVTTPPEPQISQAAKNDIMAAPSVYDLVSIYNAYATTEPIQQLKDACALRRRQLEDEGMDN